MPMHEKALVLRQASLSHTIIFQALASLCTLKTAYKYDDKKYQDIRGDYCYRERAIINLHVRRKRTKKTYLYQRMQRYACVRVSVPADISELVMLERAYGGCLGTKSR